MDDLAADLLFETVSPERAEAARALRDLIVGRVPDAIEARRTGWRVLTYRIPLGRKGASAEFAWIMVQPEHVHLGFSWGVLMADAAAFLEGQAFKRVRWVTVETAEQIDPDRFAALLDEAAGLARMGHRGRLARALDDG